MAEKSQPGKGSGKDRSGKDSNSADTSAQQTPEEARLAELRDTAEAMAKLAEDENTFTRTVEAFRAGDAERFQGELAKIGLLPRCRYICRFLCSKHCVFKCQRFCRQPGNEEQLQISEIREFAQVVASIAKDEALLKQFVDASDGDDAEAFNSLITKLKLERFCHQLCHWLCLVRCRLVCKKMCPKQPLITEVAYIPTSQITSSGSGAGLGAGPSLPPGTTSPDNKTPPTGGVGDHPFGGIANIRGVFSITTPFQYKVEYSTAPTGPLWTPIDPPILDIYFDPLYPSPGHTFPTFNNYRSAGAGGWYNIADMGLLGVDYLTNWQTPAADRNNIYYLKLTVRTAALIEFESIVIPVRVDNGQPLTPVIDLELQKPDGSREKLGCCEKVEKGDGNKLVITLTASDENFSSIGVSLIGGCGASYEIKDANTGNPLSKYYNGDITDTGYPIPTTFVWDPWAAGVSPCCYLIYVTINDRAIINNSWSGGHSNANWHSITIA